MELMRHSSITTTQRYYFGRNAQRTAGVLRAAYEKSKEGTVIGTVPPQVSETESESDKASLDVTSHSVGSYK